MWNHQTHGRLLQPSDCQTTVDRKFSCTSFEIPDIDIHPFSSLSKNVITKNIPGTHCSANAKPASIEIFVVSLLELKVQTFCQISVFLNVESQRLWADTMT